MTQRNHSSDKKTGGLCITLYIQHKRYAKRKINRKPGKSTEKYFSADNKSTMNFQESPETLYQLTSLFENPKKINIDQL